MTSAHSSASSVSSSSSSAVSPLKELLLMVVLTAAAAVARRPVVHRGLRHRAEMHVRDARWRPRHDLAHLGLPHALRLSDLAVYAFLPALEHLRIRVHFELELLTLATRTPSRDELNCSAQHDDGADAVRDDPPIDVHTPLQWNVWSSGGPGGITRTLPRKRYGFVWALRQPSEASLTSACSMSGSSLIAP